MGHFLGGVIVSDVISKSLRSMGLKESKSAVYATFFSSAIQLGIEIKDGYGPYWGFSKWDLISGTMGSFWPMSKYYVPKLQGINFKLNSKVTATGVVKNKTIVDFTNNESAKRERVEVDNGMQIAPVLIMTR